MDKDDRPARRTLRGVALALAAVVMLGGLNGTRAAAQESYDVAYCEIVARIAHDAAELRSEGLTQREAAAQLADLISAAASDAPGPLEERAGAAELLGRAATHVLQFVYSLPPEPDDGAFPFLVGAFIYGRCAAGEI